MWELCHRLPSTRRMSPTARCCSACSSTNTHQNTAIFLQVCLSTCVMNLRVPMLRHHGQMSSKCHEFVMGALWCGTAFGSYGQYVVAWHGRARQFLGVCRSVCIIKPLVRILKVATSRCSGLKDACYLRGHCSLSPVGTRALKLW